MTSSACLICLQRNDHSGNENGKGLYSEFISFCVQYLKVDVGLVELLKASQLLKREAGSTSSPVTPTESICGVCEAVVANTLKVFVEWSKLRAKLLGHVDRLGRIIGQDNGTGFGIDNEVTKFRKEVENKCFTKAQIIQPTVRISSEEIDGTKVDLYLRHARTNVDCIEESSSDGNDSDSHLQDPPWSPSPDAREKDELDEGYPKSTFSESSSKGKRSRNKRNIHQTTRRRPGRPPKIKRDEISLQSQRKSNYVYKCSQCPFEAKRKPELFEHSLTVHEGIEMEAFLKCSVCQEQQVNAAELLSHMEKEHNSVSEDKGIYCIYCPMAFTTEQQRDLHRRLDHPKYSHVMCEVNECNEQFMSISKYNEHLSSHCSSPSGMISRCEQCGRGFLGEPTCKLHKLCHMSKNSQGVFVCPVEDCAYSRYRNVTKLINHFNNKHVNKQNQIMLHRCELCKESPYFIFRKDLKIHLKNHTQEVQCQFCKQIFKGHNNLMVHHFNKHPDEFKGALVASQRQPGLELIDDPPSTTANESTNDEEATIYRTCAYCSKRFLTFQDLEKHKLKVHQIHVTGLPKEIQCEICGLKLQKAWLARHMLCHREPKFSCPHHPCNRKFRRIENLTMHIKKIHDRKDSDRDHVCHQCGKRYLSQGLLNRHVKEQHVKPFPCHLCPKTFSTLGRVNEHLRASHTNEKFQCQWCPNQYGWLVKLKLHVKKKHPENAHLVSSIYKHAMKPKTIQYVPPSSEVQTMDVGENAIVSGPNEAQTPLSFETLDTDIETSC